MHHYKDPYVVCPFDNSHRMPSLSSYYHINKCQDKYRAAHPDNRVYRCKYNYMHVFISEAEWREHETTPGVCNKDDMRQTLKLAEECPLQPSAQSRRRQAYSRARQAYS